LKSGQKRLKKHDRKMGRRKGERVPCGVFRVRGCSGCITEVALRRFTSEKGCCFPAAANIGGVSESSYESLYLVNQFGRAVGWCFLF
jgi:hypothetical protein